MCKEPHLVQVPGQGCIQGGVHQQHSHDAQQGKGAVSEVAPAHAIVGALAIGQQ